MRMRLKIVPDFRALVLVFALAAFSAQAERQKAEQDNNGSLVPEKEFMIEPLQQDTAPADQQSPFIPQTAVPADTAIKVEQQLDKAIITIGDIITYTMTVSTPKGVEIVTLPPGAQLGQFIIRDYEIPEPKEAGEIIEHRFLFKITAYTTGQVEIPPMPVFVNPRSETPGVVVTEGIQVRVAPVTNPDDLEIRDVKPPLSIPLDVKPYILAAAAAIALVVALAAVLLYLYRWRPAKEDIPEPVKPAHELAYQELRALEEQGLLEAGEIEAFYTKLSEIIRRYIALRWRIYALEYTSTEILEALKQRVLENRVYERVQWFLHETDLVKFARHLPPDQDRSVIMDRARGIVDMSKESEHTLEQTEERDGENSECRQEERMTAP